MARRHRQPEGRGASANSVRGEGDGPTARRSPPSNAREIAAHVLLRVEQQGAYAAAALNAELDRSPRLDPRERALATELVYGVLRTRPVLEKALEGFMSRRPERAIGAHLLVAAYQLAFLDRVPAFAAVDVAVRASTRLRGERVGAFVNAVLRRFAGRGEEMELGRAVLESTPAWLRDSLVKVVGESEARALLAGPRTSSVRLVSGRPIPGWLQDAPHGRTSPRARVLVEAGDPRKLPGYVDGFFVVQEEGAQAVALALGARPGDRVLDACAGRGQKTSLLREQVGPEVELWATDLHPHKLRALIEEHHRLGLAAPCTAAVDYTAGVGPVPAGFDRVLVDAPCTGVGTLRRRPEIALRLGPDDPARLADLAERILRHAATRARPGGRIVFAVCSVLEQEAERVVERIADVLEPAPFDAPELAGVIPSGASQLRLLPERHGTDGYFIASFLRRTDACAGQRSGRKGPPEEA